MHYVSAILLTAAQGVPLPATPNPDLINVPTTGIPVVDAILSIIGALYVLLSLILVLIPRDTKAASWLARLVADLKKVLVKPEPPPPENADDRGMNRFPPEID